MSSPNKKQVINKLKDQKLPNILNWIVTNLNVDELIKCLKEVNPAAAELLERRNVSENSISYINEPTVSGSFDDYRMRVIDTFKDSNIIPIAAFPGPLVFKEDKNVNVDYANDLQWPIFYLSIIKSRGKNTYTTSCVKVATFNNLLNIKKKTTITQILVDDQKLNAHDISEEFRKFLLKHGLAAKSGTKKSLDKGDGKFENYDVYTITNAGDYNGIDTDSFLMPYGKGKDIWEKVDDRPNDIYFIYSVRFYDENLKKLWNSHIQNSRCVLLATSDRMGDNKYLINRYNKMNRWELEWYNEKEIEKHCKKGQWEDTFPKLDREKITEELNKRYQENLLYSNRVFPGYVNGDNWKDQVGDGLDLRTQYKNADWMQREIPSEGRLLPQFNIGFDRNGNPVYKPKNYERVSFTSSSSQGGGAGGGGAGGDNGGGKEDEEIGATGATVAKYLKFGELQSAAAERNVYIAGVRERKGNRDFLSYMFDPHKNSGPSWSGTKKSISPSWKSERQIINLINKKEKSYRPTKSGVRSFMKLDNVMLPDSKFNFGTDLQLQPLHPMQFGYMKKAMKKWPVDRSYGQLYPLGKDAFFKGRHKGVSSTFSEQFSKEHGLWSRPKMVPNNTFVAQFQFGKKKKKSCFGSSNNYNATVGKGRINDWNRRGIMNHYTGKPMAGLSRVEYGYNGTQGVYGGYTGVAGYPALSKQTIEQGLVPVKMVAGRRK